MGFGVDTHTAYRNVIVIRRNENCCQGLSLVNRLLLPEQMSISVYDHIQDHYILRVRLMVYLGHFVDGQRLRILHSFIR